MSSSRTWSPGDDVEAVERDLDAALGSSDKLPKLGFGTRRQGRRHDRQAGPHAHGRGAPEQRRRRPQLRPSSGGADRRASLYTRPAPAAGAGTGRGQALVTARSLIRPMRRLEAAAEETGERLGPRDGCSGSRRAGSTLQAESAPPIEVRSRDEIGHLAEAFNAVHGVAVRVAGREAALRRSVGDMFLNLARRSQSLIERQLEVIERLR